MHLFILVVVEEEEEEKLISSHKIFPFPLEDSIE